jgi:hypothetical protein
MKNNTTNLGYPTVFSNIGMIIIVFLVAGVGLIYITRAGETQESVAQ